MAHFRRKALGTLVLLVILVNIYYLSHRYNSGEFDVTYLTDSVDKVENDAPPGFGSHQKGDSWGEDPGGPNSDQRSRGRPKNGMTNDNNNRNPNVAPPSADSFLDSARDSPDHASDGSPGKSSSSGGSPQKGSVDAAYQASKDQASKEEVGTAHAAPLDPKQYEAGMAMIKKVLDTIAEIKPGVQPLRSFNRDIKTDTVLEQNGELPSTSTILAMYLQVSDEDAETLKRSHKEMMSHLPDSLPPKSVSGRGIVMTGGGKYFPMVLTAIRWLRESDKSTPIEVFMADKSEYEPHICDNLFPQLNVECRVLRDIYGPQLSSKLDTPYALKPLAILASKFDDIYFMDADSYPLRDLDTIFDWDVYKETGLILNADYWPRYISPKFYDIVGITLGGRARGDPSSPALLQSDRENAVPGRSTESGQVFVRKTAHIKSLLLAMYYNLYGVDHYFPLLMQGGHGEGDKDTYAAAAIICGETYYQTQRRPITLGQHLEGGQYKGFAMSQPDPISDYERHERHNEIPEQFFALHANSIKSNPKYLLMSREEPMRGSPPLRQQRFFGDMANIRKELLKNDDVELKLFSVMTDVACEWGVSKGFIPRDWEDTDPLRLCRILKAHTKWLSEHPDVDAPSDAAFWFDLDPPN